jgi:hypothetical protein
MLQARNTTTPHNANQREDIEHIVRLVLERLKALEPAFSAAGTGAAELSSAPAEAPTTGLVQLEQRLVTLEDLRERWPGMKILELPSACIVTPAVLDELRYRGVKLQRRQSSKQPTAGTHNNRSNLTELQALLVMVPAGGKSTLTNSVKLLGGTVQYAAEDCNRAADTVQAHTQASQKYCLWSSSRPFAAMRASAVASGHVAAVQLSRASDLQAAVEQAQPSVLIVDDRQWTADSLLNLARAWMKRVPVRSTAR